MGPLAQIFSTAEGVKRKLVDALRNPRDAAAQFVGNQADRARNLQGMTAAATDEFVNTGSLRGPEQARLDQMIAEAYNPIGITLWHGSKNPTWIDRGEMFNPNMTANMPSKYLWASPKRNVAETYAGISEMQKWKAAQGLSSPAPETAGIRKIDFDNSAKILKVKDVKKTSKDLGIEWGGDNPLEAFLDAAKSKGFDAVQMQMDGGNFAILNPSLAKYGPMLQELRKK